MRQPSLRTVAVLTVLLASISIIALGCLIVLPYSTSLISQAGAGEAARDPSPDFHIGVLRWPVSEFARAGGLEPFRRHFRSRCGVKRGLEAAVCVSSEMARAFPNGPAESDFVSPDFDPHAHLRQHLAGHSGHCMNRSAVLAAELLAVGLPARVVQVFSSTLIGHTLVEVWDEDAGWTIVDPTFGVVLSSTAGPANAGALVSEAASVKWIASGAAPHGGGQALPPGTWASGTAVYPEPWLYLRLGEGSAPWPYRARYVSSRHPHPYLGPVQLALAAGGVTAGVGALAGLCVMLARLRGATPS